jgi:hypothetical protein
MGGSEHDGYSDVTSPAPLKPPSITHFNVLLAMRIGSAMPMLRINVSSWPVPEPSASFHFWGRHRVCSVRSAYALPEVIHTILIYVPINPNYLHDVLAHIFKDRHIIVAFGL